MPGSSPAASRRHIESREAPRDEVAKRKASDTAKSSIFRFRITKDVNRHRLGVSVICLVSKALTRRGTHCNRPDSSLTTFHVYPSRLT